MRAWVLVTLYESVTAMRELSGDPFRPDELDQLYGEFRAVCAEFGLPDSVLPPTAADVPAYIDRTVRERLEYSDPVRHLLFDMLRQAPPPRRLRRLGPAWPPLRALTARTVSALTVADLPPAFRERFALRRTTGATALSWVLHRGLRQVMTRLPDRLRYRTPAAGDLPSARRSGTAPSAAPADGGAVPAAARLPGPRRPRRPDARPARLEAFFRQVLDQTGDGRISAADLQAMAHNVCWQLELTPSGRPRSTPPSTPGGSTSAPPWTPTRTDRSNVPSS